jgi:hypothetical protein
MWNRRYILDQANVDSGGLQGAQRRFSPCSGTPNKNLHTPQTVIHRLFRRAVCRLLRREGSPFPGSLKTHGAGARPRDDIPLIISNRDNRVVKRRMNMHHAFGDVLSPAPFSPGFWSAWPSALSCFSSASSSAFAIGNILLECLNPSMVPASCPRQSSAALCACARWYACADLAPADFCDVASRDRTPCPDDA